MKIEITKGPIKRAQKVVIYGVEGIGKSTLAAQFPDPLFIDTEGGTSHMDVARLPRPTSWSMLVQEIGHVKTNPDICKTLVIDTVDWAEEMAVQHICGKHGKTGIEDFGYGNGYVYAKEEFGRFVNALSDLIDVGINVVLVAHAQIRKFELPNEAGAFDKYELKLGKKTSSLTAPIVKEWADMLLFVNYKTVVVNVDGKGTQKGKNKAQGNKRVMYTTHHPCWDAKNRAGLPPEAELSYEAIRHVIEGTSLPISPVESAEPLKPEPPEEEPAAEPPEPPKEEEPAPEEKKAPPVEPKKELEKPPGREIPDRLKPLYDLMDAHNIPEEFVQQAVSDQGYYPKFTPIANYDQGFVDAKLVGYWDEVKDYIDKHIDLPF